MRPFDKELAIKGKPVCTLDGRKARIICYDHKDPVRPIIALVGDQEAITHYAPNGVTEPDSLLNLVMNVKKKIGWINIFEDSQCDSRIYSTKEEAECSGKRFKYYITSEKIEWEE